MFSSSQIIISSVGGGRVRDVETNKMVRCEDAPEVATNINAIRYAHECRALVAVVAGEDHPLYPCRPSHPYAVLDWFRITDVWGEMHVTRAGQKAVRIWRLRLEKADLSKPSWWMPQGHQQMVCSPSTVPGPVSRPCDSCLTESKEIFTAGWTCLNHKCQQFFRLPSVTTEIDVNTLVYTEAFLNERTPFIGPLPELKPQLPDFAGFHGTEKFLRRGFVCPDCGHCSRRVFWNRWACESCPFKLESVMRPYPEEALAKENQKFDHLMVKRRKQKPIKIVVVGKYAHGETSEGTSGGDDDINMEDTPDSDVEYPNNGTQETDDAEMVLDEIHVETTPDDTDEHRGKLPVPARIPNKIRSKPFATIYNQDGVRFDQTLTVGPYEVRQYFLPGPDGNIIGSFSLFISNEETNSAPNGLNDMFHKLEGLTRHFQQNFGARYKFGVAVQSKGFDEAPDVVLRALHRLVWAGSNAVKTTTELLAPYDLGPDGPPPTSNDFNELLALGYMEDDRINYHDDGESEFGPTVAALSLGSPSTMRFRPKIKSGFDNLPKKASGKAFLDVLEVPMKHGDMMVMHGRTIHRYYEHAVEPMGSRRVCMTCRYIDPDKMKLQADRDDAAVKGAIPEHARNFVYNGEV